MFLPITSVAVIHDEFCKVFSFKKQILGQRLMDVMLIDSLNPDEIKKKLETM